MITFVEYLMSSENVLEARAVWGSRQCEVTFKVLPDQVTWRWLDGFCQRLSSFEVNENWVLYQVGPIEFVLAKLCSRH